jgi:hypothetical protein
MSRVGPELYEDQVWEEWQDGDDSKLYDSGYSEGYKDGLIKTIEILTSVKDQEQVDRLPSSFTVSVVIGSIREMIKETE